MNTKDMEKQLLEVKEELKATKELVHFLSICLLDHVELSVEQKTGVEQLVWNTL